MKWKAVKANRQKLKGQLDAEIDADLSFEAIIALRSLPLINKPTRANQPNPTTPIVPINYPILLRGEEELEEEGKRQRCAVLRHAARSALGKGHVL